MKKIYGQHGDVILEAVAAIPSGAKRIEVKKGFILEKGEGVHTHTIPETDGLSVYEKDGVMYLTAEKPINLTHEEHGTQVLEPNIIYKKVIEREFDYESMEARKTLD